MELTLQLLLILACLFYGARKGGIALGLLGGIGLVVIVFAFKLPPGKPPVEVMLTIIAVVAASATLQASGGLDVLLLGAERLLRRNPKSVTILAPFVTCGLTMLCGTGHVVAGRSAYDLHRRLFGWELAGGNRRNRPCHRADGRSFGRLDHDRVCTRDRCPTNPGLRGGALA